jgi:hypothetical protein
MALPKLNDTPKFITKVPSTGKQVRYRPYLVKEEKVLIMAFESGDKAQTLRAVAETIDACLEEGSGVDVSTLTTFDIEYLFTQIRAKSVGEVAQIRVKCTSCDVYNDQEVDLESVDVEGGKEQTIKINDKISVKMKYPTYEWVIGQDFASDDQVTLGFDMIQECMEAILTEEERFLIKDASKEEVTEFIESLTSEQFKKISSFLSDMPTMKKILEFDCVSCNEHNKVVLEGMSDFF